MKAAFLFVRCSPEDGQCHCLPNMVGRRCSDPAPGYFLPQLDYFLYEAELASPLHGGPPPSSPPSSSSLVCKNVEVSFRCSIHVYFKCSSVFYVSYLCVFSVEPWCFTSV